MDGENTNNPLSSSLLADKLQRFKSIYRLIQEDDSPTLNEDAKLALKRDIQNAAENIIRSHVKTLEEELLKPQEKKKCSKCGKWKKTGRVVVTALDASRRFQYFGTHRQVATNNNGNGTEFHSQTQKITSNPPLLLEGKAEPGGSEEVGQCRRERRDSTNNGNGTEFHNQTQQRTYSPLLLEAKSDFGGFKEVGQCLRQRGDTSPSGSLVIEPTLMHFERGRGSYQRTVSSDSSSGSGSRRSEGSVSSAAYSTSSTASTSRGRHQRRRSLSRSSSITSVESFVSETESSNDSGSDGSYDREPPHPRRGMLERHRDYRSRSPERDYPRRSRRSISRSSAPDDRHLRRRARRSSMVASSNHPSRSMGMLRRFTHKIGGMFHRHHPSNKDENVQHHHRSIQHHDGKVHCKSKDQTENERTEVKKKRNHQKEGHFKKLLGGVARHFRHPKESKPSTTDKRRLERAVTGKRKIKVEKLHWWKNNGRPGKSSATKLLQLQGHKNRKK
ncbi:hypothetical protein MKW94_028019 [Papaver nudicaule]|uniref:Uncharacterized protein n=1 Tax=Papaver nudicaule TaxID=74823 RepID=A0AA41VD93_PAPNU|nr:hypothetical protein [Papaver nudicaule]MCL7046504.1 hypothetical protein [Papaver nudicaule]